MKGPNDVSSEADLSDQTKGGEVLRRVRVGCVVALAARGPRRIRDLKLNFFLESTVLPHSARVPRCVLGTA